jgi:hypothetical protein
MKYFLAHNEIDVFHYGELTEEQVVETGQPNLEFFGELTELENRLFSFGVTYQNNDNTDNSPFDEILDSPEPI